MKRLGRALLSGLVGFGVFLAVLMVGVLIFFYLAMSPRLAAHQRLERLATNYAKLTAHRHFATFNGQDTYHSIIGDDDRGQEILVLLAEGQEQPELVNLSERLGYDELLNRAKEEGVTPEVVSFGRYQGQLVWEVTSQQKYYVFDAETGDLITVWG